MGPAANYNYTMWDRTFGRGGYGGGCPAWGLHQSTVIGDDASQTLSLKRHHIDQ